MEEIVGAEGRGLGQDEGVGSGTEGIGIKDTVTEFIILYSKLKIHTRRTRGRDRTIDALSCVG